MRNCNKGAVEFSFDCQYKTSSNNDCALKNDSTNDLMALDVYLEPPTLMYDVPQIASAPIVLGTPYKGSIVGQQALDFKKLLLSVKTKNGEAPRVYSSHPGSRYRGQLIINVDATTP